MPDVRDYSIWDNADGTMTLTLDSNGLPTTIMTGNPRDIVDDILYNLLDEPVE